MLTDLLHTIASMLADPNVVGDQLQNIKLNYENTRNSKGESVYSNKNSGTFWRETEKHYRTLYGDDVVILTF